MFVIDLQCQPSNPLWAGCTFEEIGGRFEMISEPDEAVRVLGRNAQSALDGCRAFDEATLAGRAPVWAHLAVLAVVRPRFRRVYHREGGARALLVADAPRGNAAPAGGRRSRSGPRTAGPPADARRPSPLQAGHPLETTDYRKRLSSFLQELESDALDLLLTGSETVAQGDYPVATRQMAHASALLSAARNLCRIFPEVEECRMFGVDSDLSTRTSIRRTFQNAHDKDFRSC